MKEYVDVEILKQQDFQDFSNTDVMHAIDHCPRADVEHVKHGHWILTQKISENAFRYNCSECNRWVQDGLMKNPSDRYPYCHCGARMDGKEFRYWRVKAKSLIRKLDNKENEQ